MWKAETQIMNLELSEHEERIAQTFSYAEHWYVIGHVQYLFVSCFIVIMCIYFCDLLYFLYTDSSVQGMSTVSYSELMLISFCFSFLLRCEARRVIVRLDKLAYPKPMYMRLCSRMLFCMECFTLWQVSFPLWTLRLLIWQHEEQFVLLFIFLWLLVYIFVWFIVFLVRQF